MTKKTARSNRKRNVTRHYVVTEVNGIEVKRTEIKLPGRDRSTGRWLPKAGFRRVTTCPYCGGEFEV